MKKAKILLIEKASEMRRTLKTILGDHDYTPVALEISALKTLDEPMGYEAIVFGGTIESIVIDPKKHQLEDMIEKLGQNGNKTILLTGDARMQAKAASLGVHAFDKNSKGLHTALVEALEKILGE